MGQHHQILQTSNAQIWLKLKETQNPLIFQV